MFTSKQDKAEISEVAGVFLGRCLSNIILYGEPIKQERKSKTNTSESEEQNEVLSYTFDPGPIRKIRARTSKLRKDFEEFCLRVNLVPTEQVSLHLYFHFEFIKKFCRY